MKLTTDSRRLFGVWNWLTPAQQAPPRRACRCSGQHWMLTPWRTVEVVHAVQRPLIVPEISKLDSTRGPNMTSVIPRFSATCSLKSTDRLDLRAEWHEPQDSPVRSRTARRSKSICARGDTAFQIKITDPQVVRAEDGGRSARRLSRACDRERRPHRRRPGSRSRRPEAHEFHDTRYRRIEYWLEGTTKFREFMTPAILTDDVGGTPVPVDDHIKVVGPRVVNWVPSSAPPPAPEVLYVVPTFGWVAGHRHSRTALELAARRRSARVSRSPVERVGVRRDAGRRAASAHAHRESRGVSRRASPTRTSSRSGPTTRSGSRHSCRASRRSARTSRWRVPRPTPPARGCRPNAPAAEADQRPGPFAVTGLAAAGVVPGANAPLVEVAPHDVQLRRGTPAVVLRHRGEHERRTTRSSAWRSRAISRRRSSGAHLSNIVLADIMPLAADRWLNVTQTAQASKRHVTVYGVRYSDTSSRREASVCAVDEPGRSHYRNGARLWSLPTPRRRRSSRSRSKGWTHRSARTSAGSGSRKG